MPIRRLSLRTFLVSLCLLAAWPAQSAPYPSHTVRIIMPFAAGGPLDLVARMLADKFSKKFGQPFIVEDRPGAAGDIGGAMVAKSAPDGYTLLMTLSTTLTVNPLLYNAATFDAGKDLRPISIVTLNSQMLVVHPSVPVHSVKEFVDYASKQPVNYAHAGYGSPGHLAMEYFRLKAGFKATPVPYKGNAPLVSALIAGQIPCGFVASAGVLPQVKAGRLRALAVSSKTRSALAPDVPTIAESGYPGFNMETFFLLMAPAALPDPVATTLLQAVREAMNAPDVQQRLRAIDLIPVATTGPEARARIASDLQLWTGVVKAAHMRVN